MAFMKFYTGTEANAQSHLDGIYLTTDSHKIFYNGAAYGGEEVDLSNYVTLDGIQEISGNKIFTGGIQMGTDSDIRLFNNSLIFQGSNYIVDNQAFPDHTGDTSISIISDDSNSNRLFLDAVYGINIHSNSNFSISNWNPRIIIQNSRKTYVNLGAGSLTIWDESSSSPGAYINLTPSGITLNGSGKTTSDLLNAGGSTTSISDLVSQVTAAIVDGAPTTLDTLNELAAALGDDPNFATTIANQLAQKANTDDLATVAISGSYNDLIDRPNLSNYVTLSGDQTIDGNKTFNDSIRLNSATNDSTPEDVVDGVLLSEIAKPNIILHSATNDWFTIWTGGTSDKGFTILASGDDGINDGEPIYVAQTHNNGESDPNGTGINDDTITRFITLMDKSGNQKFRQVTATGFYISGKTSNDLLNANGGTVPIGNFLPTTGGTINGNLTVTGTNGGTVSAKSFSSAVATNTYNPSDMNINRPYEIMGDTVINVTMAGNDKFTIAASGTSDNGFVSLYTADNGNEPIYAAQVNTGTGLITHYITLMDASGNQKFNNINANKIAITDKTSTDLLAGDGSTVSLIKDFTKYPYISEATTCEEAIKILAQKLNEFHQLQVTYKINPTPSDAQVTINGSVRNSITVNFGTAITWSVQKSGYVTQSGSDTAYHDTTKQVTLAAASVTLTINPTPSDATVKLEGFITNSITVDYGTNVQWEVSKSGYQTQSGTYQVLENHTMNVSLVEELPDPVIPSSLPSGVSIVDSVGRTFTNAEDWDESFGLTGIGINSGGHQFIFALANEPMSYTGADDKSISTPKVWSTALYQVDVPNLENITSEATVLQNFASKANTDAIMAALATSKNPSESNNAAWVARNYSAGVIAKGQWDLPAMGILKLIFDNKSGIQTLVNAIGKSYWNDIIWNVYCWSSNEYSSGYSWRLSLFDGSTGNYVNSKYINDRFVIPVFTVS